MTLAAMFGWLRRPDPGPNDAGAGAPEWRSTSRSHVGRVRSVNEDRVLDRADAGLWAVIDGMGGHAAGDVAAEAALRALAALADRGAVDPAEVEAALAAVNADLHEAGRISGALRGATIVVLLRTGERFTLCWAGDCRAYRQRGAMLDQLTRDHSVVQELLDAGQITAEQARGHPRGNVVTRALGAAPDLVVDTVTFAARPGDIILLCSDGLSRVAAGLAAPLARHRRLDATADALLAAALENDGSDNVSLVLIAADAA